MTGFDREWRDRFEARGERFDADHAVSGWSDAGLRRRVAVFQGLLDEGWLDESEGWGLELGCGAGTYVRLLAKEGHRVAGLDYSVPSLRRARTADPGAPGRYIAGEAYALPFPTETFAFVLCIGVLQALSEPGRALAELVRVLKPGGRVLVETLNPWTPIAAWRRLRSAARGTRTHLTYCAPRWVEGVLRAGGVGDLRRVPVLVPPRSLPAAGRDASLRWMARAAQVPVASVLATHAVWIAGARP